MTYIKIVTDVVCICGSTRFKSEMEKANRELTLAGKIVVAPGVFQHAGDQITDEQKVKLDRLHLDKIDLANSVYVVCPNGYIGDSTRREIQYAKSRGRQIEYSDCPEPGCSEGTDVCDEHRDPDDTDTCDGLSLDAAVERSRGL